MQAKVKPVMYLAGVQEFVDDEFIPLSMVSKHLTLHTLHSSLLHSHHSLILTLSHSQGGKCTYAYNHADYRGFEPDEASDEAPAASP